MPNTPALIGCGAAAVAAGSHATPEDMELVCRIFDSVGKSVRLKEDLFDLVTGLTGSGPAYVFRFTEALIDAAVELGMPKDAALTLVLQMVYGSSRMAIESDRTLVELRQAVTTKGGTTEAGLKVLEEGEFPALIRDCVEAATKRSAEFSKG
jgi:pyrroline-5-carboxylate reductase